MWALFKNDSNIGELSTDRKRRYLLHYLFFLFIYYDNTLNVCLGLGGGKDVDQATAPVQHKRHDTLLGGGALDRSLDKIAVKLETDFPVCVYHLTALATDCKVSFF